MQVARGTQPDFSILLPANHELVLTTPMLRWTQYPAAQGGVPQAGLALFKAMRAFLGRCRLSTEPASRAIFTRTPFLQLDLTDAAWSRILGELVASDLPKILRDSYASSLTTLDECIRRMTPVNPDSFTISAADILLRESFDTPAANAIPARGRGANRQAAVPAVAALPGPAELLFLNLCTLSLLEDPDSASSPLLPLARLAGMLGPFSTRDKRADAVSTIQLSGALIRRQLSSRFGCQADGAMAVNLKDFILDTYLPTVFSAAVASEEELRREARDACSYRRSAQGRVDVEISRINYLRPSAPNISTQIVDRCSSSLEAHGLLTRLGRALTKANADQPLADFVPALEKAITERVSTIEDCMSRPNPSIHIAVEEMLKEASIGELSSKERDEAGSDADPIPRGDAIDAALRAESFKRVAKTLAVVDTSTKLGKMDAITVGFSGDCTLAVRTLCRPMKSSALTARVPALALLNDLHPYVHSYLTWILTADSASGEVPRHLQGYSIVGPLGCDEKPSSEGRDFLSNLLSFELASVDWVYSPGGLLAYRSYLDAGARLLPGTPGAGSSSTALKGNEDVHPLDIYTRPEVVQELGAFIHRILTALGCAHADQTDPDQQGVTFKQWNDTFIEHLKRGTRLATVEERYEHLDHCHELYLKALSRAGAFLKSQVYSLLPAQRSIDRGVLRIDEEPYISLNERKAAQEKVLELRTTLSGFLIRPSDTSVPARAFQTLLRSSNPALREQAKRLEDDRRNLKKRKRDEPKLSGGSSPGGKGASSPDASGAAPLGAPPPGSQTAAWTWIQPDKELYVSGWVWNVAELAKLAKVPVASKCWPWLLTTRRESNKPAICDKWTKSGHSSASDVAHVLPSSLNLQRLGADKKYCRLPTIKEREAQQAKLDGAGLGNRGRGKGKGVGHPPGKGARGGGQPPSPGATSVAERFAGSSAAGLAGVDSSRPCPSFRSQLLDSSLWAAGDTTWCHVPAKLGIRTPQATASAATTRGILPPPLRSLDNTLRPHQILVDCGGQGQCGPNTIAYLLGLVDLFDGPGEELRTKAVDHAAQCLDGTTALISPRCPTSPLTLRELIEDSINAWPESLLHGLPPTLESWLALVKRKEAWTDIAFVQTCADLFKVCFALTGVNDLGDVTPMFVVCPLNDATAQAWLEIGCWLNRHFVAIVNVEQSKAGSDWPEPTIVGDPSGEIDEWRGFSWPLMHVSEVERLLRCRHIRPTALVGMEFSGAVRSALEGRGIRALSVDLRPCDAGGMHFMGDVRAVIDLQIWDKVYLFPPCFQQFRGDDCLAYKIADGRAFWGIATVLWCVCVRSAHSLMVEQSDTIVPDFIPLHLFPDVKVIEAHTSDFGDDSSKFIRLTCRNLLLSQPPKKAAPPYEMHRDQRNHISAEERDRARSSWARFPRTSAAVAAAPANQTAGYKPPPLDYLTLVSLFAKAWASTGYPVPKDFRNSDARPSSQTERDYQTVRGAGDGREVDAIAEESELLAPPMALAQNPPMGSSLITSSDACLSIRALDQAAVDQLGEIQPTPWIELEDTTDDQPLGPCGDNLPTPPRGRFHPFRFCRNLAMAAYVVVLCLAARPMVYACRQGCTLYGIVPTTPLTNSAISKLVRKEISERWGAASPVFLVGEYLNGPRLYTVSVSQQESSLEKLASTDPGASGFEWLPLDSLRGAPIGDPVRRSALAVSVLIRPVEEWLLVHDALFRSGRSAPTEVISLFKETIASPPAWRALHQSLTADRALINKLSELSDPSWLDGWIDVIRPLPIDALPAELLSSLPQYDDPRLNQYPLPPVWEPYHTRPRPRQPLQPTPEEVPVDCPRPLDLYLSNGRARLEAWLQAQRLDLLSIREQLDRGIRPNDVDRRHRPEPIAIGQAEMHPWARGLVWDCRASCCRPLDFDAGNPSNLSLAFLVQELGAYPDQRLLSHLIEGVSLEADVELQTVLVPHLTSLPNGFASVAKELRRLQKATWYDFFWQPPFVPFYLNGQGAVARKLEPDRYRRSTEGGGPRKPTFDASGLQAVSINFAARFEHIPKHFLEDHRPEFLRWMSERGLTSALDRARQNLPSDPNSNPAEATGRFTKWVKEVKPTLAELMQALAVLKHAGTLLNLDVYIFGDDLKDYFNQLRMQTSDLWKLNIAFLEEPGDVVSSSSPTPSSHSPRLIFVSEKRLGFGTHPASNVAQRFSYAILDIFRARMDEEESRFDEGAAQWKALRHSMSDQCHNTSRFRAPPTWGAWVCPQQRLYAAFMYTDDPIFLAVGADRAMRAIYVWRKLVSEAKLLTAIPEKRSLGSWTTWLGVVVVASLGIVFVPQNKLLRAMATVLRVLHKGCEFHEYRSLCGLLEHLRAVLLKGKGVMHGLYSPHSSDGASSAGPTAWVTCTPLMRKQLQRWQLLIAQAGGVSVRDSLLRRRLETRPSLTAIFDSDACHGDANTPSGVGGYSHGLYWYFEVPLDDYGWVNTPTLEFIGVCFSIFMADYLFGETPDAQLTVLLRTDALTTALTLPTESQRSPRLIAAYQFLTATPQWTRISTRLRIQHIFGDANVMADAVSRAYWRQFAEYCSLLRITPRRIDLHPQALNLFVHLRNQFASTHPVLSACGALPSPSPALARLRQTFAAAATPCTTSGASQPPDSNPAPRTHTHHNAQRISPALARLRAHSSDSPLATTAAPPLTSTPSGGQAEQQTSSAVLRLRLPTAARQLAPKLQSSALMRASSEYALQTASSFVGDGPMDFHLPPGETASLAQRLAADAVTGVNDNTHAIDARAWEMWEAVCAWYRTDPYRTAADVRDFPQRNYLLLSSLMLYAFATCSPRTASATSIKPNSAFAYPLAVIRIFGRWGVHIPVKGLKTTLHQLSRYYLQLHGQYSLVPRRAEPMKYSMVLRINRIAPTAVIDNLTWTDATHDVFMFRRLNLVMWPTGCRLAEFIGGTELMHFTFESLSWSIKNVVITRPTAAQLHSLQPNIDFARLTPPRSKPDQFGETHCPFPIVLMFELREGNAAAALRDLELRCAPPSSERPTTALFHTVSGAPYTHARLDRLFKAVLRHCFGNAVATAYSWHSYRSGLATALHAAGVDDARIQLICRWLCPASLLVYRRMGSAEYSQLTSAAMGTHVNALQSQNIMRLADSPEYADILAHPVKPISFDIAAENHQLVRSAADVAVTRAHERNAPVISNDAFYSGFFSSASNFNLAETASTSPPPPPRPRVPSSPRAQREPPAAAPPPRTARRRPRAPAPLLPSTDSESTTGVGALRFQFPPSLDNYQTYNERRPKRRPPAKRHRPALPAQQGQH